MKDFAENVVKFNGELLGIKRQPILHTMSPQMASHLIKCLSEEVKEFGMAHYHADFIGCIDALIDLMYFAVGGLHKMGLTSEQMAECGRIVHEANMRKMLGIVERRSNGTPDAAKPEGWESPEATMRKYLEEKDHGR